MIHKYFRFYFSKNNRKITELITMNEKTEIVTNSGDPKMFYKWKLNSLILRMVYPQIVSNFVIKYNNDI